MINQHLSVSNLHYLYLIPVGSSAGRTVSQILSVFRNAQAGKCHCSVFRQFVGIEQNFRLRFRCVLYIQYALVLDAVILKKEILPSPFERHAIFGVIPYFGQPFTQWFPERYFGQILLCDLVFSFHPLFRFF